MRNLILIIFLLLVHLNIQGLEEDKLSAVSKVLLFSGKAPEIKLVAEYAQKNNDFRLPALIRCLLGIHNLSSFICTLSPVEAEMGEILFESKPVERMKELSRLLDKGESLFGIDDLESVEWQEVEQKNRAWGTFIANKKNFCRVLCEFDAKKIDGKWCITRLMIPIKGEKQKILIVFEENTELTSKDSILAAEALIKLGKENMAKDILFEMLSKEKNNPDALQLLGSIEKKNNWTKSEEYYKKALVEYSKRIEENESKIKEIMAAKYKVYKFLNLADKAKEYRSEILLKYTGMENLLEIIDLQAEEGK